MHFDIYMQERYSRTELLLRAFFGWLFISLPHGFVLMFLEIWSQILSFITFWVILFTGRFPESFFEFQLKLMRWKWRVNARMFNLADGYPAFGLDVKDPAVVFEIPHPGESDRGTVLLRLLFGWLYVALPHGFVLAFVAIIALLFNFLAFWVILFTGKYPRDLFEFVVGFLRWGSRVQAYLMFMTDRYPPFSGRPEEEYTPEPVPVFNGGSPAAAGEEDFKDPV